MDKRGERGKKRERSGGPALTFADGPTPSVSCSSWLLPHRFRPTPKNRYDSPQENIMKAERGAKERTEKRESTVSASHEELRFVLCTSKACYGW